MDGNLNAELRREGDSAETTLSTGGTVLDKIRSAKLEWERSLDCIDEMVFLTDSEGCIRRFNNAFLHFMGCERVALLGKEHDLFFNQFEVGSEDSRLNGISLFHHFSRRWFILKTYTFESEGVEAPFVVFTAYETTELVRASEALQTTVAELNAKKTELENAYDDLQKTQAQIIQQEKMASIGQLAAGVAHEVNNPMGFITSNLSTLGKYLEKFLVFIQFQDEALKASASSEVLNNVIGHRRQLKIDYLQGDVKDLIGESLEGAHRVQKIVQDLKTFSRVDMAEQSLADLNECLESTISIAWNEIKYKATLVRDFGELPRIRCFPQKLNQVFMNLFVNAAHAMEVQGEIRVETRREGDWVRVSVSDTGCGIPEANLSRIFEPFFTTKPVGKGTGLGMSIAADIIKQHKGTITVTSELGKGTTFDVRIPVEED